MPAQPPGTFYGIGVGPGDPELITRKAQRILRSVDWIYHPAPSRSGESFVRRIVAPLGLPEAKFRTIALCMSRERGAVQEAYRQAAAQIVGELRQGRSAAWITEGDPLFYSTFLHLHEQVRQVPGVRVEIVPGVTSASAAAARAGVCVANLDERVAIVPAAYGVERLPQLLEEFATVFLLKVNSAFEPLLDRLAGIEREVEAFYLEHVGTPEERVVTDLASLRGRELPYFSLVILRRDSRGKFATCQSTTMEGEA
jgi:precorrin-2/cobalt-factor-2 C20-methyltransferase